MTQVRNSVRKSCTDHGTGPRWRSPSTVRDPDRWPERCSRPERAGARVTVLAVGTWLEQYPRIADRILRGGHDLGNHTMHHLDIAAMDASGAYAEIAECRSGCAL